MAAPSIAASYASGKAFDREVAAVRDFGARFALTFLGVALPDEDAGCLTHRR
jgi:hypothetical protein